MFFPSLADVAAAIALVEDTPQGEFDRKITERVAEIEAYANSTVCHGAQIYGAGGWHRFFVKGNPTIGYQLVMSRGSTDARVDDPANKGWLSRLAIERAEALGVPVE